MSTYTEEQSAFISGIWDAEAALKAYEHVSSETVVPCINELRYAAKHVADALQAEGEGADEEKVREHWNKAIRHTHRAKYDVLEFHLELVKLKVSGAIESYEGYAHIAAKVIPNYFRHKKALYSLEESIAESVSKRKDTPEYIDYCNKHIELAKAFLNDFLLAEEELMSSIEQEKRRQEERRHDKIRSWYQIIASCVLGGLITLLAQYLIEKCL